MRKAFSMIELIFVIVILGIVASISSQIIVQVYESYITQRAVYNVSTKTELAINQIVNRLTFSVLNSGIAKDPNNPNNFRVLTDLTLVNDVNLTMLEWVGYDNDSFSADTTPYWSGVADYTVPTRLNPILPTPGSNLNNADAIIRNLSNNKVSLNPVGGQRRPAIVFQPRTGEDDNISGACLGLVPTAAGGTTNCIYPVTRNNNTSFNLTFNPFGTPTRVSERYQLAWSAYALVPVQQTNGLFDLRLFYNYQPWLGETYNGNGQSETLIKNISVFKFTQSGGIIQIKLCATENIGKNYNISTCKEKAIIR